VIEILLLVVIYTSYREVKKCYVVLKSNVVMKHNIMSKNVVIKSTKAILVISGEENNYDVLLHLLEKIINVIRDLAPHKRVFGLSLPTRSSILQIL
jgi:hypothetical protein